MDEQFENAFEEYYSSLSLTWGAIPSKSQSMFRKAIKAAYLNGWHDACKSITKSVINREQN